MSLLTNLQGYWKLDEASGNAVDSSGNSNTLINTNTVTYSAGKLNNGANFAAASGQYFTIADAAQIGLDFSTTFGFSGWVKYASDLNAGVNEIIAKTASGDTAYLLFASKPVSQNKIYFRISNNGSETEDYIWDIAAPTLATWYHYVVNWSVVAGTPTAELFINGVSQGTKTGVITSIKNSAGTFNIGRHPNNVYYWDGSFDEVGIWSRILTTVEVGLLYNSGNGLAFSTFSSEIFSVADVVGTSVETLGIISYTVIPITLADIVGISVESMKLNYGWTNQTKHTSTWTNAQKSMALFLMLSSMSSSLFWNVKAVPEHNRLLNSLVERLDMKNMVESKYIRQLFTTA